jgi:hypothetical protein
MQSWELEDYLETTLDEKTIDPPFWCGIDFWIPEWQGA